MRKMTKTVVTLAAMSAMTAAAASMAFAATNSVDGLNAVKTATEAKAAGANSGTWGGDDKEGWTFTTEDGIKLKNTWAEIDGVWYYFHKDGKMAQDEIVYLDGESYFFNSDGSMMANGWKKIKSDSDAYSDLVIDDALLAETNIAVQEDWAYAYYDYVWCYFFADGHAAENEWFQDESGLWYYFDELVMVMNTYNYYMNAKNTDNDNSSLKATYGFDTNGAMLVGWNYKEGSTTLNKPTADAAGKTWYYYNTNGKMQTAGWKKIDGNWYLFADGGVESTEGLAKDHAYPLIVNSYVTSYPAKNSDPEFFYLNEDGKMQTGIVTLPKKVNIVTFYQANLTIDSTYVTAPDSGKPEIYFGSKGAAEEKLVSGRYYTLSEYGDILVSEVDFDVVNKLTNTSIDVIDGTAFDSTSVSGYNVEGYYGRVIKSAFIGVDDKELYLADEDGDVIATKAVRIENTDDTTTTDDVYVLFDRYGEAYQGYTSKNKSVVIGGKTYWSTGNDVTIAGVDVSVFKFNKLD